MSQYKTFSTMASGEKHSSSNSNSVHQIKSAKERKALINNNRIVVVDNYTDWCGPCKQCAPKFADIAQKYKHPGLCDFAKENVEDKCGEWPVEISGVPCFHFYINGQFQDEMTITGADIGSIERTIKSLLT